MKLVVQEGEPTLFEVGDVLEAEIVPSAGTGRAILIVERKTAGVQWLSPRQATGESLGVQEGSERELGMLRAAGYRLPVIGGHRK